MEQRSTHHTAHVVREKEETSMPACRPPAYVHRIFSPSCWRSCVVAWTNIMVVFNEACPTI